MAYKIEREKLCQLCEKKYHHINYIHVVPSKYNKKMVDFFLKLNQHFVSDLRILSKKEMKHYQYCFREKYISNNEQIVSLLH